jgi:plasmid maintenance system antidote protein VapI
MSPSDALGVAMTKIGLNNSQLARLLGVSETIVRGLRNGTRPLRDDRIAQFGPRLRAAFGEALRGPVQLKLF